MSKVEHYPQPAMNNGGLSEIFPILNWSNWEIFSSMKWSNWNIILNRMNSRNRCKSNAFPNNDRFQIMSIPLYVPLILDAQKQIDVCLVCPVDAPLNPPKKYSGVNLMSDP